MRLLASNPSATRQPVGEGAFLPAQEVNAGRSARLPAQGAFYLQVSIVVVLLAGSSAPTPLYAIYQAHWGFSPITTTVVFGIYALAVLVALLTVGGLSDFVGRRPVLLAVLVIQAVTMLVFATAAGVGELAAARVAQGLATGAAVGALGAGLLDLDRARGTLANAVAPLAGTATGALVSGILITFLPAPTRLVYVALCVVLLAQAAGVAMMAETSPATPGALASLRPRFALPANARGPVLVAVPALVAVWSLAGLYGSLGPTLTRLVTGSSSFVLAGLALFVLAGSGAVAVFVLRATAPRAVMAVGAASLVAGVSIVVVAVLSTSSAVFFAGTAVAGIGFGAGFQGALRTVLPTVAAHERAGVLSTLFVACYLAMGLPAVVAGILVVHGGGVVTTTIEYGAAVCILAALALIGLSWPRPTTNGQNAIVDPNSAGCPEPGAVCRAG